MYNTKPEKTITGIIKCENCGVEIKWHYIIRTKEYGIYSDSYPNDNMYHVRCHNCDKKNYFQYIEE